MASLAAPLLIVAALLPAPAEAHPVPARPTPEQIQQAVRELGDDDFATRERASRFLWHAGREAEPALREALLSPDAEVVARARQILTKFKYGFYPDTPPEVSIMIMQFRLGDANVKRNVLRQLSSKGEASLLLRLLKTEENEGLREQLVQSVLGDLHKLVPQLLLTGEKDRAEQFLELAAAGSEGMRDYTAYLLVTGRLDRRIDEVRARLKTAESPGSARLLAYMLRARGDLEGALAVAEKAGRDDLTIGLLREAGKWDRLARRQGQEAARRSVQLSKPVESLGYLAAYQRLAGDRQAAAQTLEKLRQVAEEKAQTRWDAAEALLVNSRIDAAIDLLRADHPSAAFDVLAARLQFREALAVDGVESPGSIPSPWMGLPPDAKAPTAAEETKRLQDRVAAGARVAGLLARLGEPQSAERLFDELFEACEEDRTLPVKQVLSAAAAAGFREKALDRAAVLLERIAPRIVFGVLYPKHSDPAEVWFEYFRSTQAGASLREALGRTEDLCGPAAGSATPLSDALLDQAARWAEGLTKARRAWAFKAMASTCERHGREARARRLYEAADGAEPSATCRLHVADLLAAGKKWPQAAEAYRQAWELDKTDALVMFLHGWALEQAGQAEEGRKWKDLAHLAPLGRASARYALADGLEDRGLADDAARQWELLARTGDFDAWALNEAARHLGNRASGKDNLRAADCWQRQLMSCLSTSVAATKVEGYLRLVHLVHKARGRGLVAAGRFDEALAELELARQALPGDVKFFEDVVPALDEAGRQEDADALFEKGLAVYRRVVADFPGAALYWNNGAWMAARCGRRLDEALAMAGRATELEPDKASYLDTLAEVHFRRGDRAEAVRLARRCIELAPEESHFREQLARFERNP